MAAHVRLGNPDGVAPDSDTRHSSFHQGKNSVRPTFHLLRISHIWNSVRLDMSESSDRIFHIRRLTPDGRAGRFNFPGQTYPDLLIALTRRASAADISAYPESIHGRHFRLPGFCAVPRCSPEASRYVRPTF